LYINKNQKTTLLPKNFLDYFSALVKNKDNKNQLIVRFNSPKVHYVSKKKKQLKVKVNWKHNHPSSLYEWTFYPTLWQDGDSYSLILDKNLSRVFETIELTYSDLEGKSSKKFLKNKVE
jgi:hypothetical protein